MTNMHRPEEVLKTDALGRVRTSGDRRKEILDEFERSGISGVKFAALTGIKYQTFATWIQKRRRERRGLLAESATAVASGGVTPRLQWVEAVVERTPREEIAAEVGGELVIELRGGARLRIGDRSQIELAAQLLGALGEPATQRC